MYKITITQIEPELEEEIIVRCHEISDEVLKIVNRIKQDDGTLEVLKIVNRIKQDDGTLLGTLNGETFRILPADIFYIESVDNKTFFYCKNNVYESKQRLYELEEQLKNTKLFRCSKAMILNIGKIRSVSPSINGRFEAKLTNGETVIISRQYVPVLKKRLGM